MFPFRQRNVDAGVIAYGKQADDELEKLEDRRHAKTMGIPAQSIRPTNEQDSAGRSECPHSKDPIP